MCKEPEKKATSVRVLLPFSLYASFVHKIGTIDCVHAEGLAFMNTLSIVLYLFGQGFRSCGSSDESLDRKSVYSLPATKCKSGVRARIYEASHKSNTVGDICCC